MLFIPVLVKADELDINIIGQNGALSGNLNPYNWVTNVHSQKPFNYRLVGVANDGTIKAGQRYQVKSVYCVAYTGALWTIDFVNSSSRIINNGASVQLIPESCVHTDSNGNVHTGNGKIEIIIDFTIASLDAGTLWSNYYINMFGPNGSQGYIMSGFLSYDIFNQEQISNNDNTDKVIDNSNANTDKLINNQNANTDRLINNSNANSQAEIDATDRNTQAVNGVNDSINNTDTTGSENALSSIINDPAFQDNTGMGVERMACIIQNASTNYETDLFLPIIKRIETISNIRYDGQKEFKVIADHIRSITFAVSDGAIFDNFLKVF